MGAITDYITARPDLVLVCRTLLVGALTVAALPAYLDQQHLWADWWLRFQPPRRPCAGTCRAGDCVRSSRRSPGVRSHTGQFCLRGPTRLPGCGISGRHSALDDNTLWDVHQPVENFRQWAAGCTTVWVLTDGERDTPFALRPMAPYSGVSNPSTSPTPSCIESCHQRACTSSSNPVRSLLTGGSHAPVTGVAPNLSGLRRLAKMSQRKVCCKLEPCTSRTSAPSGRRRRSASA